MPPTTDTASKSRRGPRTDAATTSAPSDAPNTTTPAPEPTGTLRRLSETSNRLAIPLRADGAIDIESMRPATRDRLLKAIKTSNIASGPAVDRSAVVNELKPLAGMVYNALGGLSVSLASMAGYSRDEAAVMLFSEHEKQLLVEPTARVLAKYSDSLVYADEVLLATTLLSIVSAKVAKLRGEKTDAVAPGGNTVTLPEAVAREIA